MNTRTVFEASCVSVRRRDHSPSDETSPQHPDGHTVEVISFGADAVVACHCCGTMTELLGYASAVKLSETHRVETMRAHRPAAA